MERRVTDQPEKLDLKSMDLAAEKQAELLRLFPEIRTEGGKIDFDRLKLALGETVDVGRERYGLNWPGKSDCFKTIQAPSLGTLRPAPKESVNFDTTENLIIEGDNLEVLKLLQKSYLSKIKLIYIDPPYNTGKDFIYPDNFGENLRTYLEYTGQLDSEGREFGTNTETDGRFHSKWLSMLYPRLYLARNLLKPSGIILVSIDAIEVSNLRLLMNEVFGEENFVELITVVRSKNGMGSKEGFSTNSDFVLCYKTPTDKPDEDYFFGLPQSLDYVSKFDREDKHGKYKMDGIFRKKGQGQRRIDSPGCYYPVFYDTNGVVYLDDAEGRKSVTPKLPDGSDGRWVWSPEYAKPRIHRLYASQGGTVYVKDYWTSDLREKPKSVFDKNQYTTEVGTEEIKAIFGDKAFDTVKPVHLLSDLISNCCEPDGIVMDFFAGSGTTAHAVFDQNLKDGASRKFILVQLPEPTETADYPTIADLTKERVRRVIKKLNEDGAKSLDLNATADQDRGFRVFKLDQSNFMGWDAGASTDAEALGKQLDLSIDHVRQGRSDDDLFYELLLKSGFPLTTPVEKLSLAGKAVYSIGGGVFLICLERELTTEAIKAMADMRPSRVVCLDDGFRGNDQLKSNAVLTFKAKGVAKFQTV